MFIVAFVVALTPAAIFWEQNCVLHFHRTPTESCAFGCERRSAAEKRSEIGAGEFRFPERPDKSFRAWRGAIQCFWKQR